MSSRRDDHEPTLERQHPPRVVAASASTLPTSWKTHTATTFGTLPDANREHHRRRRPPLRAPSLWCASSSMFGDRSTPTTGCPASVIGSAIDPVPTPISSTVPGRRCGADRPSRRTGPVRDHRGSRRRSAARRSKLIEARSLMATAWHHRRQMIPIVTPAEMAAIDAAAPEPVEVLIGRAGAAVARAAIDMLGGTYGRRVVVLAGKGNNGNDGRDAARRLRRRGVRVAEVDAHDAPRTLPPADLVIDAAFGTGFRGSWRAPETCLHPCSRSTSRVVSTGSPGWLPSACSQPSGPSRSPR